MIKIKINFVGLWTLFILILILIQIFSKIGIEKIVIQQYIQ